MKIVNAICSKTIPLGRLGENDYTLIRFDVSGWLAEYPDAVIGLYNQRPGDNSAYPVADLTVNGGVAEWQITNVELTQTGQGKCQLVAIKDSVVIKSMIYGTIILDALDESGDVPDPWVSWEDRFIELKGEAEQAASDAESAKDQILGMRAQAITLAPGSEATANYDDGVLTLGIPQGEQGAPGQDGAPGAKGDKGDKGDTGATGAQGQKGEKGDKGDKGDTGDQGQKGDKGDPGDPTELIDDNAGAGVTDKVWSASKSAGEVSDLLSAISSMNPAATASDVGKALLVKTVEDGKPTSWEYGEAGGGGTSDYDDLTDKPQINGNTLSGNKTGANLGLLDAPSTAGTSGQVLVSDGNGGQVWGTTGSGTITVDSTLSVSGAAADAAVTGSIKNAVNSLIPLNPDGVSFDLSGVSYGVWKNANVGDTITTATNNNCRRIMVDMSAYVGWVFTLNLQGTNLSTGPMTALCNSSGVIAWKDSEYHLQSNPYTVTLTTANCYLYLAYTAAKMTSVSAKVISDVGKDIASIPDMQAKLNNAVIPISLANLCANANIDDTTGFGVNGSGSISASDNVLTLVQTAQNVECTYTVPITSKEGHKYYFGVDLKANRTTGGLKVKFQKRKSGKANTDIGSVNYNHSNPDAWQRLSLSCPDAVDSTYAGGSIVLMIYDNQNSNFINKYIRRIVILDLTEIFGAGNEPNTGEIDNLLASYTDSGSMFFEGTLQTNIITNEIYPDKSDNKPIYVGISGYVMNVNAKYDATHDIQYQIGKAGSNELFNWRGFSFIDNTSQIVSPQVDLTQTIKTITDWFGPHKLKVANNADGDMPNSDNFTGGNHAYNGDSSGTPTARTASYAYYVDGRKVTEFAGYAYYVDVYWQNFVQATNTKKSDGTGREVLKETMHMHFDGVEWKLDVTLEPLEELASWSYYGIQMSRGSAYSGYIFYHDCPENRTWHATNASSESGANTCRTITMHDDADYFEMHIGPDGLGDFALLGNYDSFFSSDSKTYSNLVKGATSIAANSVYTFNGYYKWYSKDLGN